MTSLRILNDLLLELFNDGAELRRFLALHTAGLHRELPDTSLAASAFAAADLLLRRNEVTPGFVAALVAMSPGQREKIAVAAHALGVAVDPGPSRPGHVQDTAADRCDVLLVTVTDVETRCTLDVLKRATGRAPSLQFGREKTYFCCGRLGGADIVLARSEMGTDGVGAAVVTVRDAIAEVRPGAIVMLGLAFGVDPARQNLGDVLVSKQIQAYDVQRVSTGAETSAPVVALRGDRVSASPRLLDRLRTAALEWGRARVSAGLLLSGQKLIDHKGFRDDLRALVPEAMGGEMEGAGVYAAAGKTDWILVKAICDWADGTKHVDKEARQNAAATNAAKLVVEAIGQGGFSSRG